VAPDAPAPKSASSALEEKQTLAGLVLEPSRVNLGTIPVGSQPGFDVILKNTGNGAIEVVDVQANCGCARVKVLSSVIKPGEETRLTGVVSAGGAPSVIRKTVTMHLKWAGRSNEVVVPISAEVVRTITFSPDTVTVCPDFMGLKPHEQIWTVHNNWEQDIALYSVEGLPAGLVATIENKRLKPGESCAVRLVASSAFSTTIDVEANLLTSHPIESMVPLRVRVRPRGSVEVFPKTIHFGVISKNDILNRNKVSVLVKGESLTLFDVKAIECPSFLHLKAKTVAGENLRLDLSLVDAFSGAKLEGAIRITLKLKDGQREHVIEVPVFGLLRDAG
jgi:hypothetical protein